jgi:hypothetical protein
LIRPCTCLASSEGFLNQFNQRKLQTDLELPEILSQFSLKGLEVFGKSYVFC